MIKSLLCTSFFVLALPLSSMALTENSPLPKYQAEPVRLGCGVTKDVWAHIDQAVGDRASYEAAIPVKSEEDARYYLEFKDGSWLMTVEYISLHPPEVPNFMCIVAKGERTTPTDSIEQPVSSLPREIIAPQQEHTKFSMLR